MSNGGARGDSGVYFGGQLADKRGAMRLRFRNPLVRRSVSVAPGVQVYFSRGRKSGKAESSPVLARVMLGVIGVVVLGILIAKFAA